MPGPRMRNEWSEIAHGDPESAEAIMTEGLILTGRAVSAETRQRA